ncbi:MAG TPA: glycosyltransferase family 87 protein [Steroidobacteraceae bacterium]|nr:glycosyltransferase family 87 protein [Steroidobacteraceae bacterium]
MSAVGEKLCIPEPVPSARGIFATARFWIYISCAAAAVLVSYLLGKEMMWDTLDYHLYAGFSAWHDRFGHDYFAAGAQAYLNPYVYAPFYALVRTGLPALLVASVLAIVQSGILWLTYELAIAISPPENPRARIMVGAFAVALALANPILLDQLGTSYADILTGEIVLAAWLLLVHAVRTPNTARVICAGLLLGAASALKLTNSLHALSACILLLFLPTTWRLKAWLSLGFFAALAVGFVVVALPWSIQLQHHFGNPFFPLFNNIFRSPQFPTAPVTDFRYVPGSLAQGLLRPFAMVLPEAYVDDEFPSPDLRYALLSILALVALVHWAWRRFHRSPLSSASEAPGAMTSGFMALASAFLVDWILWLRISGNGRYFLAMACVAGILCVVLTWRIFSARSRVLAIVLTSVFAVQVVQLAFGTVYRTSVPWDGGPWYEVSVPAALKRTPNLYFILGEESQSFLAPYFAKGSGFINPDGDYVVGAGGANGAQVEALIREYAGHVRVGEMAGEFVLSPPKELPDLAHANDTLAQFGLRVDTTDCSMVIVRAVREKWRKVLPATIPLNLPQLGSRVILVPQSTEGYVMTCHAVPDPASRLALAAVEREPDLVFEHMESQCPWLFQPPRPVTQMFGDSRSNYLWMRKYPGTGLTAVVMEGVLKLVDGTRGGRAAVIGSESDWARGAVRLTCGRQGEHYYARVVPSGH